MGLKWFKIVSYQYASLGSGGNKLSIDQFEKADG